jgi:hypothetical protein
MACRIEKAVVSPGLFVGRHSYCIFASPWSQVVAEDLDIGKAIHKADSCIMMMLAIRVGRDRNRRLQKLTVYRVYGCLVEMASRYGEMQVRFPNPRQCVSKTESAFDSPFQTVLISVPLLFPSSCSTAWMTLVDQSENTAGVSTCIDMLRGLLYP